MSSFAVLTPSYATDFELCCDLNRSVLEWTPADVQHHIIVPRGDVERFSSLRGARTTIWTVDELLPRRIVALPVVNMWLNLRRPYPPVRGWVMQQVVKLSAAAQLGADVLLMVDSDIVLVRPVTVETFQMDGKVRFYRREGAVHEGMPRHIMWHDAARRLLGLPPVARLPLPDYVCSPIAWNRQVVHALQDRIERVSGRLWLDAIASQLHVSECILYGVFVDEVLGLSADVFRADSMLCHNYYDEVPLAPKPAAAFVGALPPDDVAVMISAKSGTPLDVRRNALSLIPSTVGTAS
jgi:hypothetical protein